MRKTRGAAILAFLVTAAYWPGTYAPALVPKWAVLLVGLPLVVPHGESSATALQKAFLVFIAYAVLSLLWAPFRLDGIYELGIFALLAGSFLLGNCLERCDLVFIGAGCGLVPSLIVGMMQWFGASPVLELTPNPAGLFVNANLMGEASALVIAGLLGSGNGLWACLLAVVPVTCLALSHHRTSIIALAIAGMIFAMQASKKRRLWIIGLMVFLSILIGLMGYGTSLPQSFEERIQIWHGTLAGLTLLGHGAGSFRGLIWLYFLSKSEGGLDYAHNDLLQLGFEYGAAALIPAACFAILALRSVSPMRYVLIVFGIQSSLEFPLYMPVTGFLAAFVAGHCAREWPSYGWRDVLRGMALFDRLATKRSRPDGIGGKGLSVRCPISQRSG